MAEAVRSAGVAVRARLTGVVADGIEAARDIPGVAGAGRHALEVVRAALTRPAEADQRAAATLRQIGQRFTRGDADLRRRAAHDAGRTTEIVKRAGRAAGEARALEANVIGSAGVAVSLGGVLLNALRPCCGTDPMSRVTG